MVVSLVIVLILLAGTLWLLKRFLPGGMPIRDQKFKLVRIIERVPIAPRQTLYLLWVIDRVIVVASNQGQLSTLAEIRDQNVIQQNMPPEFTDILNKANLDLSEVYKA